jgi:hypothetical protein
VTLIVYFVVGRLLIWFLQTAGPIRMLYEKSSFLTELFECDFCLGVWMFLLLGFALEVNVLDVIPYILGVVITAIIASFVTHIFVAGWRTQYGTTYVE